MKYIFLIILIACLGHLVEAEEIVGISAPYNVNSYSASAAPFTPYATPTDVCTISALPSHAVKVLHVRVWGTQTTGGVNNWFLIKRSTLDTAGTSSAITSVQHEILSLAPFATVLKWTAAPTPGTSEGTVRGSSIYASAPAGTSGNSYFDFDFGPASGMHPIILRNNETLALNFNGAAVPAGMSISCEFQWNENK